LAQVIFARAILVYVTWSTVWAVVVNSAVEPHKFLIGQSVAMVTVLNSALQILEVRDVERLHQLIETKGKANDWYVSAFVGVIASCSADKIRMARVEDELIGDTFTECMVISVNDVKEVCNTITDRHGLGLRKTRVKSDARPGCVYVCVNEHGPTTIFKNREGLDSSDRRLSTEERVRRTSLQMKVVGENILSAAFAHACNKRTAWLTAVQLVDAEECKKRIVVTTIDGMLAEETFECALIAEVPNCWQSTERLTNKHGLGSRTSKVRSKHEHGCVVLFLKQAPKGALQAASAPETSPPLPTPKASKCVRLETPDSIVAHVTPRTQHDPAEEKYLRQVQALEKRFRELVPTFAAAQLSTAFVQEQLEEAMKLPAGRLDRFRLDIGRIWRAFADTRKTDHCEQDDISDCEQDDISDGGRKNGDKKIASVAAHVASHAVVISSETPALDLVQDGSSVKRRRLSCKTRPS